MQNREIWKPYPLKVEHDGFFEVEVSNFGRVKTFNSHWPEGKIIKGSLRLGYPIVSMKLFTNRTPQVQKKIDEYNLRVKLIEQERRDLKKIKDISATIKENRLEKLKSNKLEIIEKRKKYIKRTDKKRCVYTYFLIHRAVAELFLEKKKNQDVVIHKDFNKLNNHVDNLEWMRKVDAEKRYSKNPYYTTGAYKKDFLNRDKTLRNAKLTSTQVLYIKEKLSQGKTLKELAHKFGVSDMQIHRIKTGENWSDVKTINELKEENKKWQAT